MGRRRYPLSEEALEEIRRFVESGRRRHAIAGAPPTPSYRDIGEHLLEAGLSDERIDPKVLWRACKRTGIKLPARRRRRPPSKPTGGRVTRG